MGKRSRFCIVDAIAFIFPKCDRVSLCQGAIALLRQFNPHWSQYDEARVAV